MYPLSVNIPASTVTRPGLLPPGYIAPLFAAVAQPGVWRTASDKDANAER
jgi:hypothetical protein